ncbi:LOW QUALITY PROTEIN: monocarboxylate transporter 14-like [Hetaerina americana]|uniref:LOW QUALITY PROTEIN: monocarboxylate transporter 14-like n=1 Tax=Hetaerina americana TaxID=62018 RepID=UPI003A7F1A3F
MVCGHNAARASAITIAHKGDNAAGASKGPPRAPDGGWGWMIVVASMGISLVADGISFSFGIIYIEFLRHFQESKSKTSVIGSLFMAVPLMAGPLASALVDRFGCRSMTILGGVVSAAGFVVSSQVDSIEVMCFTFGILAGLGLALCYVTAVVSVAFWFDRKRSLANGLGVCGTGVGTFLFAPLTQTLIETYGWRGTTLILAGAFLQMCICGAVMREPASSEAVEDTAAVLREIEEGATRVGIARIRHCGLLILKQTISGFSLSVEDGGVRRRLLPGIAETTSIALEEKSTGVAGDSEAGKASKEAATRSLGDLDLCAVACDGPLQPARRSKHSLRLLIHSHHRPSRGRRSTHRWGRVVIKRRAVTPETRPNQLRIKPLLWLTYKVYVSADTKSESWVMSRLLNVVQNVNHEVITINSISCRGTLPLNNRHDPRVSSCPDIYRVVSSHSTKEKKEKWYNNFLHLLMDVVDFSMFLEWHFMLLSFSTFLLYTFFIVPYFYLAEHVISLGCSESEASMLISIIGILNTVGMIALGWAGDQPWMNVTKTYALCLCLCGILTGIMPLLTDSYPMLAIDCALFGLVFASNFSFTPVIIVELISLDRFTMAYGLILLTQGLGNLLGPPLAGWLYDITNSWNISFYLAGFFIFISGLAILLIKFSNNFIIGQRRVRKRNICNHNHEEGIAYKQSLLEAG